MQASISLSFLVLALVASSPAAVHGQPGVHLLHAVGCVSTGCCPGPCVSCHVCLFISLSCSGGCSSKLIQPADSGTRSQTGYAPRAADHPHFSLRHACFVFWRISDQVTERETCCTGGTCRGQKQLDCPSDVCLNTQPVLQPSVGGSDWVIGLQQCLKACIRALAKIAHRLHSVFAHDAREGVALVSVALSIGSE